MDDVVCSDEEWAPAPTRQAKRPRALVPTRKRVLLVGHDNVNLDHVPTAASHTLAPYMKKAGKVIIAIVIVSWAVSTVRDCSDDAALVHDVVTSQARRSTAESAARFLDYQVEDAGWVPEVPYIVGQVAQACFIISWRCRKQLQMLNISIGQYIGSANYV
jgi:hypothetical protein